MRFGSSFSVPLLVAMMAVLSSPTVNAQSRATKPATTQPTANLPSFDDTLKWLTDFLPSSTGATDRLKGLSAGFQQTTTLQVFGGCRVSLTTVVIERRDVSRPSETEAYTPVTFVATFSFSDIDPASVVINMANNYDPPSISVTMGTKNGLKTVIHKTSTPEFPETREGSVEIGQFADSESANRVVKAFRHAAELCANTQPF
jgi:hypothetical protein